MRLRCAVLLLLAGAAFPGPTAATETERAITAALAKVRRLESMRPGKTYTLPARGENVSGKSDEFLRRRDPAEILASGLSCGCGDHAAAFYGLMREKGAKLLYLDAARISAASWVARDHGHTGVAVFDPEISRWVLVDPTNGRLLSYDWDPEAKIYQAPGGPYWIWYLCKLEDYPARNHAQLREGYDRALRSIPPEVWEREAVRIEFSAGKGSQNPRLGGFIKRYAKIFAELPFKLSRRARVTILDSGEGASGECHRSGPDAWACPVGRDSAMSPSFFSYVEEKVTEPR